MRLRGVPKDLLPTHRASGLQARPYTLLGQQRRQGVWKVLQHSLKRFFFFFLVVLAFELNASRLLGRHSTPWATPSVLFCVGYFQNRVSWTICPGWLQTLILLISASHVARITGMSHWYSAKRFLKMLLTLHKPSPRCSRGSGQPLHGHTDWGAGGRWFAALVNMKDT
jgi:hypothetical protein